ncbi:MAG: hypothetical protein WAO55_11745 [Candidatus Manganitrophaceae bacterium]
MGVGGQRSQIGKGIRFIAILFLIFPACRGENAAAPPRLPTGAINISKSETLSIAAQTAASGSTVYAVWQEQAGGQNMEVLLARSTDGGAIFEGPINVSQSSPFSGSPKIAVAGNLIYVVWEESVPERDEKDIFFRQGEDQNGSLSWSPPLSGPGKNLSLSNPNLCKKNNGSPAPCPSQEPSITAFGDHVFVAWGESTEYLVSPITGGQTATQFTLLNSEIHLVQSSNRGIDFSTPLTLSGPKPNPFCGSNAPLTTSLVPTLASGNGSVYIAWEDCVKPNSKILFRRWPDPSNGLFDPPLNQNPALLSGSIKGSNRPELAADGDRVFLLWQGFPFLEEPNTCSAGSAPNAEILFIRSENQGVLFTSADNLIQSNLSNTPCGSGSGRIASSGSFVDVVWMETTPGSAGLRFRQSENGGITFALAGEIVEPTGSMANPAVSASGGSLFTFWEDATLGNLEIVFLKR